MRFLVDTVTFLLAATAPANLSRRARGMLQNDSSVREISALSLSEIAIKSAIGKLTFDKDDLSRGLTDLRLRVLPYTGEHGLRLFDLPLHHSDPFDRQIIAQALAENIPIITPDEQFRLYNGVKVIW